jgi:tetratricopeptide (TPR) repeat protein
MLEILETGRLRAGIWIPSWEQGLPPLTEARFPRAYRVAPRKGPEQRTDTRALSEEALLLYKLGRTEEALANCKEIARQIACHHADSPHRREAVAWVLYSKMLFLYKLGRKDEELRVCNEILRRFGRAKKPTLLVATALARAVQEKVHLLYELGRKGEVLPVCEQFLRLFDPTNAPREAMRTTLLFKIDRLGELGRKEEAFATCVEFLGLFDTANTPRETIEMVLSAKEALLCELGLSESKATSKPTVENDEKTTYNPPDQLRITEEKDVGHVQGPLHDYLKSLGVPQSRQPELAAKIDAFAKAEITGREAAPVAEAATHEASGAKAKPRAKLNPRDLSRPQVVAVIEDSTLGRLHRRYIELLERVARPQDGFKTVEQAREAARLSTTFDNLQARREKVGLKPLPKDDRVLEAKRLSVAFYRQRSPKLAHKERPGKSATLG